MSIWNIIAFLAGLAIGIMLTGWIDDDEYRAEKRRVRRDLGGKIRW